MRRREFITGVGGAVAWPLEARAQQTKVPVIGFLSSVSAGAINNTVAALRRGLQQQGFTEGETLSIEYRWADNQYDRLAGFAADLVRRQVAVIVAAGGTVTVVAAKAVTSTTPIVFTGVSDPVKGNLVASLNRPGGNVTGVSILGIELDAKRLELLYAVTPTAHVIGALVNPNRPETETQIMELQTGARSIGRELVILRAGTQSDFAQAFRLLAERGGRALVVGADPFFAGVRAQIIALAASHAVPAIYQWREFAEAGGLMSYGPSIEDAYQQAGNYAGRILKGEKPANLPVVQSPRIELVLILKTAKDLGLNFPNSIILRADEVIE